MADNENNGGKTLAEEFGEVFGKDFRDSGQATAPLANDSKDYRNPTRLTPIAQWLGADIDRGTALEWGIPITSAGLANQFIARRIVANLNHMRDNIISRNIQEAERIDAAAKARNAETGAEASDAIRKELAVQDADEVSGLLAALNGAVEEPMLGINDYLHHNTGYKDVDLVLDAKDGSGVQRRIKVKDLMGGSRRFPQVLPENWSDPLNASRLVAQMAALPRLDPRVQADARFIDDGIEGHDPIFDAFVGKYRSDLRTRNGSRNGALSPAEVSFNNAVKTARMYRDYINKAMMLETASSPGLGTLMFRPDALERIVMNGTPKGGYPAFDIGDVAPFVPRIDRPTGRSRIERAESAADAVFKPAVVNGRTADQWRAERKKIMAPRKNKRGVEVEPAGVLKRNFGPFGHSGVSLAGILAGGLLTGDALGNYMYASPEAPGMTPEMWDVLQREQQATGTR